MTVLKSVKYPLIVHATVRGLVTVNHIATPSISEDLNPSLLKVSKSGNVRRVAVRHVSP